MDVFIKIGFFILTSDPINNALDKIPSQLKKRLSQNLCVCNEVPKMKIITAIVDGAITIDDIKRKTYATMGSGCCKLEIERLIEYICAKD
jgi:NAD(P)H-nitrite reductase large subunit